jgi:hypothetical protein
MLESLKNETIRLSDNQARIVGVSIGLLKKEVR